MFLCWLEYIVNIFLRFTNIKTQLKFIQENFLFTKFIFHKKCKKVNVHSLILCIKRENASKKLVESELLLLFLSWLKCPQMFINDKKVKIFFQKFKSPFNEVLVLLKFSACVTKVSLQHMLHFQLKRKKDSLSIRKWVEFNLKSQMW